MPKAHHLLRLLAGCGRLAQDPLSYLRHSAATLLRAAGIPTPAISKLLGHASTRTTDEVYSHVLAETEREAAAKMDEIFQPRSCQSGGEEAAVERKLLEILVRPDRFELPTFWFVANDALQISNLHGLLLSATDSYFQ